MKPRLATPGPTEVPQRLLLAGARELLHHRSPDMEAVARELDAGLRPLFGTTQPVYTMVSSGTGAMESAVANCFRPGDEVLVVRNGYFGERFESIARGYGLTAHLVDSAWGTSVNVEAVARAYAEHPAIRGVLVVYSETSTGALNDVEAIGELFAGTDVLVVVDAISGLLVHELPMDAWGLDVVLAASHKGFMLPPGLAFVAVSDRAWPAIEAPGSVPYYWSYRRLRQFAPMAPSSPAVSLLTALRESLIMLNEEGLPAYRARHALLAEAAQRALVALGFRPLVAPPHQRSHVVTSALAPQGIDTGVLLKMLRERYGLTVTGGQAHLKGALLRVGHIGGMDALDLCGVIGAVEMALLDLGHDLHPGAGVGEVVRTVTRAGGA